MDAFMCKWAGKLRWVALAFCFFDILTGNRSWAFYMAGTAAIFHLIHWDMQKWG